MKTAEEAKKAVETLKNVALADEWSKLESLIDEAIEHKEFTVQVASILADNKKRLENLGYIISLVDFGMNESCYEISWF